MISWFEKHDKISFLITILIAFTIFYLSSKTFSYSCPSPSYLSLIYHFFAFFFLSFFLLISLTKGKPLIYVILLAILISIIYGISDEIHQFFVPGRYCSFIDILIDSAGVLISSLIYSIRISKKKISNQNKIIF